MPRLFIGLPLPDSYQPLIADTIRELDTRLTSKTKWVSPENAHITLQFLGQAEDDLVWTIRQSLTAITASSITIQAGPLGCYPDAKEPHVVWVGLTQGEAECAALSAQVKQTMQPLGFKSGNRPFHGHITLGRIKRLQQEDWQAALTAATRSWPSISIDHFILWESTLTPEGPIYTIVETFPLK